MKLFSTLNLSSKNNSGHVLNSCILIQEPDESLLVLVELFYWKEKLLILVVKVARLTNLENKNFLLGLERTYSVLKVEGTFKTIRLQMKSWYKEVSCNSNNKKNFTECVLYARYTALFHVFHNSQNNPQGLGTVANAIIE